MVVSLRVAASDSLGTCSYRGNKPKKKLTYLTFLFILLESEKGRPRKEQRVSKKKQKSERAKERARRSRDP